MQRRANPRHQGKKSSRKGVAKKSSEQIRRIISEGEESRSKWQCRGDPILVEGQRVSEAEESRSKWQRRGDPMLGESEAEESRSVWQRRGDPMLGESEAEESRSVWQRRGDPMPVENPIASEAKESCPVRVESEYRYEPENLFPVSSPTHPVTCHQHPTTTTTLVMSSNDFHNINIGSLGGIISGTQPPPLVPAGSIHSPTSSSLAMPQQMSTPQQRPFVDSPFWVRFIFGNISRCNGCKGKISRGGDKKLLPPPDDIVLGHKEYVIFHNPRSGNFEQSREKRNVYYHPWKTCVAPHFSKCTHYSLS